MAENTQQQWKGRRIISGFQKKSNKYVVKRIRVYKGEREIRKNSGGVLMVFFFFFSFRSLSLYNNVLIIIILIKTLVSCVRLSHAHNVCNSINVETIFTIIVITTIIIIIYFYFFFTRKRTGRRLNRFINEHIFYTCTRYGHAFECDSRAIHTHNIL